MNGVRRGGREGGQRAGSQMYASLAILSQHFARSNSLCGIFFEFGSTRSNFSRDVCGLCGCGVCVSEVRV